MCSGNRVPFVALDIATIFNHYGRYHRHDANFFARCSVRGCGASYRKLEGFRSHIRRHHKDVVIPGDFADGIVDREALRDENLIQGINEPQDVPEMDFQKRNALFLLKMKEVHQLTEIATTTLLSDTTSLVQSFVERVEDKVKDCLQNAGIVFEDIPGMKDIFSPDNEMTNPFTGLKTKTEQKHYFQDHFGLVVRFTKICMLMIKH
jgi:hypothetical protein